MSATKTAQKVEILNADAFAQAINTNNEATKISGATNRMQSYENASIPESGIITGFGSRAWSMNGNTGNASVFEVTDASGKTHLISYSRLFGTCLEQDDAIMFRQVKDMYVVLSNTHPISEGFTALRNENGWTENELVARIVGKPFTASTRKVYQFIEPVKKDINEVVLAYNSYTQEEKIAKVDTRDVFTLDVDIDAEVDPTAYEYIYVPLASDGSMGTTVIRGAEALELATNFVAKK